MSPLSPMKRRFLSTVWLAAAGLLLADFASAQTPTPTATPPPTGTFEQPMPLDQARRLPVGTKVIVRGIVTVGQEFGGPSYMQDATAGIPVFSRKARSIQQGDDIIVRGSLKLYSNLLEFDPVDTIIVVAHNRPLPAPKRISLDALDPSGADAAALEGLLVRVPLVRFDDTVRVLGFQNYTVRDGVSTNFIRVDNNTTANGMRLTPGTAYTVTGVVSRHFDLYQLMVRDSTDIVRVLGAPIVLGEPKPTAKPVAAAGPTPTPAQDRSARIAYARSLAEYRETRYTKALSAIDSALTLAPRATYYYQRGLTLRRLGRGDEAIQALLAAEGLDSKLVMIPFALGNAYLAAGQPSLASDAYGRATTLDPTNADAAYGLGLALFSGRRFPEAAQAFSRSRTLDPQQAKAWTYEAACALEQDQPATALPLLQQAITLAPTYGRAHLLLARALNGVKQSDLALLAAQKASELGNTGYGDGAAAYEQGVALTALRRMTEARAAFATAAKDPTWATAATQASKQVRGR